jgi:hypothetical protein
MLVASYCSLVASGTLDQAMAKKKTVTLCCSGIGYLPNDHKLWTAVDSRVQFTNFFHKWIVA